MLLCFTLAHPGGVPSFSVMHIATEVAGFPVLLGLYYRLAQRAALLGWEDAVFAAALVVFLPIYPIGALLGVGVLFAFGLSLLLTARGRRGGAAVRALGKLVVLSGLILPAPGIGFYPAWWAGTSVAARHPFASERPTDGPRDEPPQFWDHV